MKILKQLLDSGEEPIHTYEDFWQWFATRERAFYDIVKADNNVVTDFLDPLHDKLDELQEGFFYLTGMYDATTAELIITADAVVKNIVFVEELVAKAPLLDGWKFTALKPSSDINASMVNIDDYNFGSDNIYFYSNDMDGFPDEIDITIVHDDLNETNKEVITEGVYIFLEVFLGEMNFATMVDGLDVIGRKDVTEELIPIARLKDFLIWREKEFVEKYEDLRYDTADDTYGSMEAMTEHGDRVLAVVNMALMAWDGKASHPWIMTVNIPFNGTANHGLPDNATHEALNKIEEDIMQELKDYEGYLNVGRETWSGQRLISFACKDFRKPSKVLLHIQQKYSGSFKISYDIYKDKYWQSFDKFLL